MSRVTHLFAYLNSTAKDWQSSNGISRHQISDIEITDKLKKVRREWRKYHNK